MSDESGQVNGWHEWSKFVLKELERLNVNQEKSTAEMKSYADQMRKIVEQCNVNHRSDVMQAAKELKEHHRKIDENFEEVFTRIDKVESWKDKISAGLLIIGLLVTTAWGKILKVIP